jgi:hypothetical protein
MIFIIILGRSCACSNIMKILSKSINILGFLVTWHLKFVLSWLKCSVYVIINDKVGSTGITSEL